MVPQAKGMPMRLITLRLGEKTTDTLCGDCDDFKPCEYGNTCGTFGTWLNEPTPWAGRDEARRLDDCVSAEKAHTQALHAARIDALESVGACVDMTGDRVVKELDRLRKEVADG